MCRKWSDRCADGQGVKGDAALVHGNWSSESAGGQGVRRDFGRYAGPPELVKVWGGELGEAVLTCKNKNSAGGPDVRGDFGYNTSTRELVK